MKRASLIAACIVLAACHDSTNAPTAVVPTLRVPPPTFVVFGIVRDESGVPVFGATAEIVVGQYAGRTATSNADGYFAFAGVAGELTIRVFRDGYERVLKTLTVKGDVVLDVQLSAITPGDTILLGKTIRSSVASDAPPCDPFGWDARAPCKPFRFTAPRSGVLVIIVSWESGPELDVSIVTPPNNYLRSWSSSGGAQEASLTAPVESGVTYEIRVNAYYSGQVFQIHADLASP